MCTYEIDTVIRVIYIYVCVCVCVCVSRVVSVMENLRFGHLIL